MIKQFMANQKVKILRDQDEDCIKHKHIAYRYVIGNHNYAGNTIIVEGIN